MTATYLQSLNWRIKSRARNERRMPRVIVIGRVNKAGAPNYWDYKSPPPYTSPSPYSSPKEYTVPFQYGPVEGSLRTKSEEGDYDDAGGGSGSIGGSGGKGVAGVAEKDDGDDDRKPKRNLYSTWPMIRLMTVMYAIILGGTLSKIVFL